MTIAEKIADRKAKIQAYDQRIDALERKKAELQKEIDALQNSEIRSILQEINIPFEDVCDLLKSLKA